MPVPVKSVGPAGSGDPGVEQLRRPTNGTIKAEKARLRKATKEFESFFIYQMLKTMRQTIPESSMSKDTPMSEGLGKDTYTDIFDLEIARKATFGGHNSIAELLYRSMEKLVDAQFEQRPAAPEIKPLKAPNPPPPELKSVEARPLPDRSMPMREIRRPNPGLPVSTGRPAINHDPIMGRFGSLIDQAARENRLDSALIRAVIRAESNGDPQAVSPVGAKGLMQLVDSTAQDLKVRDPFDPAENIRAGSRYLRQLIDRFGNLKLALAAYNAGPANVERHGGVPPFAETRAYVRRVTALMEQSRAK